MGFHATRLSSRPQVQNRQILPEQTEQAILPSSQIVRTTSSREQTTDILKKTHEKDDTEMTEENQKTKPHKKDRQTKYDEENEESQENTLVQERTDREEMRCKHLNYLQPVVLSS